MKLSHARIHAQALKYDLQTRAIQNWGNALRYCLVVVIPMVAPAVTAWLLTRGR